MKSSINFAFLLTCFFFILGSVLLLMESSSIAGVFIFAPISLWPLMVSIIVAFRLSSMSSQIVLSVGSVLYAIWFGFVYMSAFHWHPDAQSAIALVFVGIYSLPVMIPVWSIAFSFSSRREKMGEQGVVPNP